MFCFSRSLAAPIPGKLPEPWEHFTSSPNPPSSSRVLRGGRNAPNSFAG